MRRLGTAAAAAALLTAGVLLQSGAAATSTKYYGVTLAPASVAGGATSAVTLTLANCGGPLTCSPASTQTLGSANVTPAAGFSVSVATATPVSAAGRHWTAQMVSGVLQLRAVTSGDALAPGDTLPVTLSVAAPCAPPADPTWQTIAKQSNSFNGPPGNDFTYAGSQPLALGIDTTASGPLDHFGVDLPSSPFTARAGVAFDPTVTALDRCGRTVTGYDGSPSIGGLSTAPNGAAPDYGSWSFSSGVATPGVTAKAAETGVRLTVTDGSATGTSTQFDVAAGDPDHLAFTGQPGPNQQVGTAFTGAVTLYDRYDNVATSGSQDVTLNLVPPSSTLLGGVGATLGGGTATPQDGVASFTGLTVDTAGSGYTLTASYPGIADSAPSDPFDVFDSLDGHASDNSTDVSVQLPKSLSGEVGVALNATPATCGSLSSLGSLFIVKPLVADANFDISVTLTINRFYLNGIGVANIVVCKNATPGSTLLSQLPDCPKKGKPTQACVVSRNSSNAGDAIIKLLINSEDPIGAGFG